MIVLEDSKPTAKKQHQCDSCLRVIEVGETYQRQRGIADDPYVWKCCAHCRAFYDWVWHVDRDAFDPDYGLDLREWLDCGMRAADFEDGFRAGWRDSCGGLLPVPAPLQEGDR